MKVVVGQQRFPQRGAPPEVGFVYQHPRGRPAFKIVVGVTPRDGSRPWNNVHMILVNTQGEIVGTVSSPFDYVKNHHDLIGKVEKMPTLKISWLQPSER